jgi:hypothetical protein
MDLIKMNLIRNRHGSGFVTDRENCIYVIRKNGGCAGIFLNKNKNVSAMV